MNRVKLPRAVCNALDDLIAENFTNYQIIYLTAQSEWTSAEYMCLNSQDVNDIMRALVVGYEVELTSEEQLKLIITKVHDKNIDFKYGAWYALKAHGIQYDWLEEYAE